MARLDFKSVDVTLQNYMVSQNLDQYFFVSGFINAVPLAARPQAFVPSVQNCEWAFSDRPLDQPRKPKSRVLKEPFDATLSPRCRSEVPLLAAGGWCRWEGLASGSFSIRYRGVEGLPSGVSSVNGDLWEVH